MLMNNSQTTQKTKKYFIVPSAKRVKLDSSASGTSDSLPTSGSSGSSSVFPSSWMTSVEVAATLAASGPPADVSSGEMSASAKTEAAAAGAAGAGDGWLERKKPDELSREQVLSCG